MLGRRHGRLLVDASQGPELEAVLRRWVTGNAAGDGAPPSAQPARVPDGDGVLDATQFGGLRQLAAASGDPSFLGHFVERYLDQARAQLDELRAAVARRDAPALKELAHGLKGTSATMGATRVASAAAALEEAAARGQVVAADGLELVVVELERATIALRAQVPPGPS